MTLFLYLVFPPDVEPKIYKVTKGMKAVFTVKFSSAIAGNGFQWQHNEINITGERARMMNLTIVNAAEMDEGNYTCIVTFSSFQGSITSNRAQLLVCKLVFIKHDHFNNKFRLFFLTVSPANIITHPYDQTVAEGDSVTFSVDASGDGLTYQWQRNGMNIEPRIRKFEGISNHTLIVNNVQVEDTGLYKCIVYNEAGDGTTSDEAILQISK